MRESIARDNDRAPLEESRVDTHRLGLPCEERAGGRGEEPPTKSGGLGEIGQGTVIAKVAVI